MHSLSIEYLNELKFSATQVSTLTTLGEYRGKQALYFRQTPEILKTLQQAAIIESSESSNRIEGITAPRQRVEALVLKSTNPANRSEQEIAGYRDGLSLIHESGDAIEFKVNIALQIHSILHRYLPQPGGQWKPIDNEIVERDHNGSIIRVRFTPVSAIQTPQAMESLVERYEISIKREQKHPLIVIPLTILDFLCIHPFTDGNGRLARLLTLLLLYKFDYQVGRYISLERIFEETKDTYYETLEESSHGWHDARHDVFPWMNYFWGVLLRAYAELEDRVGVVHRGRGIKTQEIVAAVKRRSSPFSISEIEADCPNVSRDMIRVVLRKLREEGVVRLKGKGRGAKWVLLNE